MTELNPVSRAFNRFQKFSLKKRIAIVAVPLLTFLLVTPMLTYAFFAQDITDKERLMNRNKTGLVIRDRNNEVIYSQGKIAIEDLQLEGISDTVEKAVIASEDKDFYNHPGYSVKGMAGAFFANIANRDLQRYGGSTITQQLVKNNLLNDSKSFMRKYQELSIAVAVDRNYTKDEILEMYLNSVYFGERSFGIGPAAKAYFNKSADQLDLAESAMLVGVLPAPSAYSPLSGDFEEAKRQQERVLDQMLDAGFINEEEKTAALAQELALQPAEAVVYDHAQHYVQMILEDLEEEYGEERMTRSGFNITTGLDLKWQKIAEEQVKTRVSQLTAQKGENAGLVAIDPKTGQIRALVGSADWNNERFGKVNMAVMPRQPGSSFKPIYYAEAIDKRLITPATILEDKPTTFGNTYKPENYDFKFRGNISVRNALALSLNIPAVKVMEKVGVNESVAVAQRMGIATVNEPEKYGLSLALGTAETRLLDMTNAYAAYANYGSQYEKPVLITKIQDKYDKVIFADKTKSKRVISEQASFLMSSILSDKQAGASTFGSSLTVPGKTAAAKTGTTNDNKDAWTIGYTPSLAVGVWLGNNQNEAMSGIAGSSGAAPIWRNSMQKMLSDQPNEEFKQPSGIEKVNVCVSNGLRATRGGEGVKSELVIRGSLPKETCNTPVERPKEEPKEEKKEEEKKPEKKEEEAPKPEPVVEEDETDEEPVTEEPVEGGRGGDEPDDPEPEPTPTPEPGPTPTTSTTTQTTAQ